MLYLLRFRTLHNSLFLILVLIASLSIGSSGFISYVLITKQIKGNSKSTISTIIDQNVNYLQYRINELFYSLIHFSNNPDIIRTLEDANKYGPGTLVPSDRLLLYDSLYNLFARHNEMIDSITLMNKNSVVDFFVSYHINRREEIDIDALLSSCPDSPIGIFWLMSDDSVLTRDPMEHGVISLVMVLGSKSEEDAGYLIIDFLYSFFRNSSPEGLLMDSGFIALVSDKGFVDFTEKELSSGLDQENRRYILAMDEESFNLKTSDEVSLFVVTKDFPGTDWKLAAFVPTYVLMDQVSRISKTLILSFIGIVIISSVLVRFLIAWILKPFDELSRKMETISVGNMQLEIDPGGPLEVNNITQGIVFLLERLDDMISKLHKEQEERQRYEIDVLKSQVNPHFLYNTLDVIKQFSDLGENANASSMIVNLSKLLRIGLNYKSDFISVEEELEYVRRYLHILEVRYPGDFVFEIECLNPALYRTDILKIVIQPLVENAIYHGLKEVRRTGIIRLTLFEDNDGHRIVTVWDNGKGIERSKLDKLNEMLQKGEHSRSNHIGLLNVQNRLRLCYGREFGIFLTSKDREYTVVTMKLPGSVK